MPSVMESLNSAALRDERIKPHPARRIGGTKKISIFVNNKGEALALDLTSGKTSGIWVSAHIVLPGALGAVEREKYPADRPRNSNLSVPELTDRALIRFAPSSMTQASAVIDYFATR